MLSFVFISSLSLKHIYVQCLKELFYTFMKDLVEISGQFNVYIFHKWSSEFLTLLNATASLKKSSKCYAFISCLLMFCFKTSPLCFEFLIIQMLDIFQIIYIYLHIYIASVSDFLTVLFYICQTLNYAVLNLYNPDCFSCFNFSQFLQQPKHGHLSL